MCDNCKHTGHVSKVCKSRAKASGALQAQVAEADNAHEEQLFAVSYFSISESLIHGFLIVVVHITCAMILNFSNSSMILTNLK